MLRLLFAGSEYAIERSAEQARQVLDRRKQRFADQLSAEAHLEEPIERLIQTCPVVPLLASNEADSSPALVDIREDYDQAVMVPSLAAAECKSATTATPLTSRLPELPLQRTATVAQPFTLNRFLLAT